MMPPSLGASVAAIAERNQLDRPGGAEFVRNADSGVGLAAAGLRATRLHNAVICLPG